MPKKQVILSYIPYFFAILIFYILSDVLFPFLQENVWGVLTWTEVLGDVIKSFISVLLIFLSNTVIDNFRSNQDLQL
jgi:fucose 4-O-acetylase-like acetyltransferase